MRKFGFRTSVVAFAIAVFAGGRMVAQVPCVGDCNGNNAVAINELIVCVNIALGNSSIDTCVSCDANGNGSVSISELIQAVNAALSGCEGAVATPTPTMVEPTATPAADIENAAGASAAIVNAVAAIPNVVGAILAGVNAAQSAGAVLGGLEGGGAGNVDPCELGGSVTETGSLPNLGLVLDNCRVSRPGGSVLFDGTLDVTLTNILQLSGTASFDALIRFFDESQQVLTETTAELQSNVRLFVAGASGNPCAIDSPIGEVRITRVDLTSLTGTLATEVAEGSTRVTWQGTNVSIAVNALSQDCVPVDFAVTVNGDAEIERQGPSAGGAAVLSGGVFAVVFDVTFANFVVSASGDGNTSQLQISGDITSSCVGETITLSTPQSLSFLLGEFCPSGGTVRVEDIGDIVYSPSGVTVDGTTYPSCADPALLQCTE